MAQIHLGRVQYKIAQNTPWEHGIGIFEVPGMADVKAINIILEIP